MICGMESEQGLQHSTLVNQNLAKKLYIRETVEDSGE